MSAMQPRRYALVVAALLAPLLFIAGLGTFHSRSLDALWDVGHVGLFLALTAGVLDSVQHYKKASWKFLVALIASALGLAAAIELLQGFVGRSQSIQDVLLSLGGAVIALAWNCQLRWSKGFAVSTALVCIAPTAASLIDEWSARRQFPVLAEFISPLEVSRFRLVGRHRRVRAGLNAKASGLALEPNSQGNLGWQLAYAPSDWSDFRHLEVRFDLTGDSLAITCVLTDARHERVEPHEDSDHYAKEYVLFRGSQLVRLDLATAQASLATRLMNLDEIGSLRCSAKSAPAGTLLILESIRLRK